MGCAQTDRPAQGGLEIRNLSVDFQTPGGIVHAVRNVSLHMKKGRITAMAGESGSGKSVTSLAVMGLLARNGRVREGQILLDGQDILQMPARERKALNGRRFGMIFQDPAASLDPLFSVEDQMTEGIRIHSRVSRREAHDICLRQLSEVNLVNPEEVLKKRPFELSGGMCQRVMIAIAMAQRPDFLIADEPTTALDVTVQKQILRQICSLTRRHNTGVLFITHDLGVVAEVADEVAVMKDGEIVEYGDVLQIFDRPVHPYTKRLLAAVL